MPAVYNLTRSPTVNMICNLQVVCLFAAVALSVAKPQIHSAYDTHQHIPILAQQQDGPNPDGSYQYSYQTGNGIAVQERGYLKNPGNPQAEAQVAEGSYQYTADDGQVIQISYVADENGFHAEGNAIPTSPPIPAEIQRALDFLKTQPQQEYDNNGNPIGSPAAFQYQG